MYRQPSIVLILLSALLSGCASDYSGLTPLATSPGERYTLDAGDEIRVAVFGLDAITNSYAVNDAGEISVPLLKNVAVKGRTTSEVETLLAGMLRARDIAPQANVGVQIVKYRPFYILGEVQKPGEIAFAPGMTILKAVSIAGGYTFRADKRYVLVTRGAPATRGRADATSPVKPGDTIQVPEAWF